VEEAPSAEALRAVHTFFRIGYTEAASQTLAERIFTNGGTFEGADGPFLSDVLERANSCFIV
jgi:hypothetical protein